MHVRMVYRGKNAMEQSELHSICNDLSGNEIAGPGLRTDRSPVVCVLYICVDIR